MELHPYSGYGYRECSEQLSAKGYKVSPEPHLPEGAVNHRMTRGPIERVAECQHGELFLAGARLGKAEGNLSFRARPIEHRDQL